MTEQKIATFSQLPLHIQEQLAAVSAAVVRMEEAEVVARVEKLLTLGVVPVNILVHGLMSGMAEIAESFKQGNAYVTEVLLAAQVMDSGIALINPYLAENQGSNGCIIMGTVAGDLHNIGKRMVAMMLRNSGYRVIDLGVDIPPEEFAHAIRAYHPQILGLSALLTTTTGEVRRTINFLNQAGLHEQLKIIVGGAPLNQAFADNVGADGYADDAFSAVELCRRLLAEVPK
ncbi:MAG: corrinoid protein [Clostridiales bacterium]